jgi:hypothetical protein
MASGLFSLVRALAGRRAVIALTGGFALYASLVVATNQAHRMYPSTRPKALEDLRTKSLKEDVFIQTPDPKLDGMLGHGWYGIEGSDGCWSQGKSSVLALPAQDAEVDMELELRLGAAGDGESATNSTAIFLNGKLLGTLPVRVEEIGDYRVTIPSLVHEGEPMLIVLVPSYFVQASARDSRHIGIKFMGLRLLRRHIG